jgi:DNA polymerase/3'-5' exonuclease PolX
MQIAKATAIAERIKAELAPYTERIEIAGSVRRRKPEVKDIELVAVRAR